MSDGLERVDQFHASAALHFRSATRVPEQL